MSADANATCIYFDGLFESRPSKYLLLAFSSVSVVVLVPLFYAISWFGRSANDKKQTLVTSSNF
jgi:hypothetical protein